MYDWPEVQWANDALWAAIRDRLRASGIAAPENLDRNTPREELWTDPALVLSQTCAWPYVTRLTGRVALVATPVYDVDGCVGPLYSSFLIARADQRRARLSAFRGLRFAFNAGDSLSGYVALRQAMKSEGLGLSDVDWHETGGHRASLLAVSGGVADLAAIDAVCWALAGRHDAAAVAGSGSSAGRHCGPVCRLSAIATPILPDLTQSAARCGKSFATRRRSRPGRPFSLPASTSFLKRNTRRSPGSLADYLDESRSSRA
jgi:hypothetical protein